MAGIELVVVNYHTPVDLARFCDSLMKAPPSIEWHLSCINVDAQPPDINVWDEITARFADTNISLDRLGCWDFPQNIGYARACNFAARHAEPWDHDYLAFFNADVTLRPDAIDECVAAMAAHPDWAVLGPRQVNRQNHLTHAGIFGTNEQPKHRAWKVRNSEEFGDVAEAVTVSGSAYFVRRTVWDELTDCPLYQEVAPEAVGAFLPTTFYFEETWCSYHAREHGHKVMFYGPVVIEHEWHQASPIGGWGDQQFPISREFFRKACATHGIACD